MTKKYPWAPWAAAALLAAMLSGCGGGGGSGMMPGDGDGDGNGMVEEPMLTIPEGLVASSGTPVFADMKLLEALLPGGDTVFPPVSAAMVRDYDNGSVHLDDGDTSVKSVSSDGSGGFRFVVVLDGEEIDVHFPADSFVEQDGNGNFAVEQDGTRFRLWSQTGSFRSDPDNPAATVRTDGSDGNAFFDVLEFIAYGDGFGLNSYLAFGARTRPEDIPQGTATYDGRFGFKAWNEDDTDSGTSRSRFEGDLSLEANFSQGTISGTMDELESRVSGEEYSDMAAGNRIDIANGQIAGGQFTAEWAGHGPEAGPLETVLGFEGDLLGEFYGPAAEEVAGVLNGHRDATATAPAQVVHGQFQASTDGDGILDVIGPTASALAPVYAQGSGDTVANSANVALGPQVIQRHRDWRNTKQRIREGASSRTAYVKSIAPDGSGGYHVTYVVDGSDEAIHFDQFMGQQSEEEIVNGDEFNMFVWGEGIDGDPSTPRSYYHIASSGVSLGDDYSISSWSVFGLETQPARLLSLGSATYTGGFYATLAPPNGALSRNWRELFGDLMLDADFSAGDISGQIDSLQLRESKVESADGNPVWADLPDSNSIAISGGQITDSRFRADWAGEDTDAASDLDKSMRGFSGEMLGAFYGPDGEEIAGVAGGGRDATATTQEWLVQGAFAGTKEEETTPAN